MRQIMKPLFTTAVLGLVPVPSSPARGDHRAPPADASGALDFAGWRRVVCERMATKNEVASIRRELGRHIPYRAQSSHLAT
jgi:hypothetical protein